MKRLKKLMFVNFGSCRILYQNAGRGIFLSVPAPTVENNNSTPCPILPRCCSSPGLPGWHYRSGPSLLTGQRTPENAEGEVRIDGGVIGGVDGIGGDAKVVVLINYF